MMKKSVKTWTLRMLLLLIASAAVFAVMLAVGWRVTTHAVQDETDAKAGSTSALEAVMDQPGPVVVETIVGADWQVPRSGLINLDNPKARESGLKDEPEPIQIFFHALRHPTRGLFLVDTGIERALKADPAHAAIRGMVANVMQVEKLTVGTDTATWLSKQSAPPSGVLFTHLHLDHVAGLPDVPREAALFAGPGETSARSWKNFFVQSVTNEELAGHPPIRQWRFSPDPDGKFEGVLDIFGDQTVWALWVPGHTPGGTAYVVRTPDGPVLLTGDACHTEWGWQHGVEPGTFSSDMAASATSLERLRALSTRHPRLRVLLGHQSLGG